MNRNDALMTRALRVDPAPGEAFEGLASSTDGQATLTAILESAPPQPQSKDEATASTPRQRTFRLGAVARRTLALAVVGALVIGITTIATPDRPAPEEDTIWAAELVSFAEGSPRLLLGAQSWSVIAAQEITEDTGEMMFATSPDAVLAGAGPGEYWMSLNWYPSKMHDSYVQDRRRGADATWKITIDGHQAVVFQHDGTAPLGVTFYAIWVDGIHSLELRTDVISTADQFNEIALTAKAVDVDTWLSAMPASVVEPEERGDAVDRILADIPVPSNVDVEAIKNRATVSNGMNYEVTTAVLCGWVQQWIDARKASDEASLRQAVNALAGSREWAAMKSYGGRSYVVDVADAMAAGTPVNGDRSVPVGVTYQRHLGCPEG